MTRPVPAGPVGPLSPFRALAAAWLLLTIIPLPGVVTRRLTVDDWARGAAAFPLVGVALALLVGGAWAGARELFGVLVGGVVAVLASAILTAALHLDGLADCADALGARGAGEERRSRRLEIMRDSSIGTYGALALVGALLLQIGALVTLEMQTAGGPLVALAVALPAARTAAVCHAFALPPARTDGLGAAFIVSAGACAVAVGCAGLLAAATAVGCAAFDWFGFVPAAPLAGVAGAVVGGSLVTVCSARGLGGRTGDTLGATVVVAETFALLGVLAAT
ncbi:MAG: adenosylcobinamide-GDP ribazoletransferase [Patulibacter sp.]